MQDLSPVNVLSPRHEEVHPFARLAREDEDELRPDDDDGRRVVGEEEKENGGSVPSRGSKIEGEHIRIH